MILAGIATTSYAGGFILSSTEIKANSMIPIRFEYNGYGCKGDNRSPELSWSGAPKSTRSFAVTIHDPDANNGAGWWHWVVINISANVHSLPANAGAVNSTILPAGAEQVHSDFGIAGWGGPCPPKGDKPHHYVFTVYALKTAKLELPVRATAAQADALIQDNTIAKARFVARYGRK